MTRSEENYLASIAALLAIVVIIGAVVGASLFFDVPHLIMPGFIVSIGIVLPALIYLYVRHQNRREMKRDDSPSARLGAVKVIGNTAAGSLLGCFLVLLLYPKSLGLSGALAAIAHDLEHSPTARAWIIALMAVSTVVSALVGSLFIKDEDQRAAFTTLQDVYSARRERKLNAEQTIAQQREQGGQLTVTLDEDATRGALSDA